MVSSWGVRDASQAAHYQAFISPVQDRYASVLFNGLKNLHQVLTNSFLRSLVLLRALNEPKNFYSARKIRVGPLEPWFYSTLLDFNFLLSVLEIAIYVLYLFLQRCLTGTKVCTCILPIKYVPYLLVSLFS